MITVPPIGLGVELACMPFKGNDVINENVNKKNDKNFFI